MGSVYVKSMRPKIGRDSQYLTINANWCDNKKCEKYFLIELLFVKIYRIYMYDIYKNINSIFKNLSIYVKYDKWQYEIKI